MLILLLLPFFTVVGRNAVPHPAEGVPERRPEPLFEVDVVDVALLAVEGGERPGDAAVADAAALPARISKVSFIVRSNWHLATWSLLSNKEQSAGCWTPSASENTAPCVD